MAKEIGVGDSGIKSYDALMSEKHHSRGFDQSKEREAVAHTVSQDEPVVARHFASSIDLGGEPYAPMGAVILSTSHRLIVLTSKGNFRVKILVESMPYTSLKPSVASRDGSVFGDTVYLAGIGDTSGRLYTLSFFTPEERNEFVSDVGGALGGWHMVHEGGR